MRQKPKWDKKLRRLSWGRTPLKRFRRRAPHQEPILDAFQDSDWVEWIANPLPQIVGRDRKEHLAQTVENMNRWMGKKGPFRFQADGGNGVSWEVLG
jgi:hypothetical protein